MGRYINVLSHSKLAGLEHSNLLPNLRVKTCEKSILVCHDKIPPHLLNPKIVMLRLKKVNRNNIYIAKSWRWGEIRHLPVAFGTDLRSTDFFSFQLSAQGGWYELRHNDGTLVNIDNLAKGFITKKTNPSIGPTYIVSFCNSQKRYAPLDRNFMRFGVFALAIRIDNPDFPAQKNGRPNDSEYIYMGTPRYLYSVPVKFKLTIHSDVKSFSYSMQLL